MTPLCELARKHGTDKGGWHQTHGRFCHEYTPVYDQLLGHRRHEVWRVLEVGVHYGGSLRMWADYLPNAQIVGLDIYEPHLFTEGRIECHLADQGRPETLLAAVAAAGGGMFDLIVDDGSHDPDHQTITATTLLPHLSPGGIYVIEDFFPPCLHGRVISRVTVPDDVSLRMVATGRGLGGLGCQPTCPHCHGTTDELLAIYEHA
jgi:hypothetical protein